MKPVIIAKGESIPVESHPEARVTEPVVQLDDDHEVKRRAEKLLNAAERRRFQTLWREARRNGYGVKLAIRAALRRQIEEATERLEVALARSGGAK
jgi:hypothetical protein